MLYNIADVISETCVLYSKIYTTLDYIVSLMLLNLGHLFRFHIIRCKTYPKFKRIRETIWSRVVYIFNYKMFHPEASVETIKMCLIQ